MFLKEYCAFVSKIIWGYFCKYAADFNHSGAHPDGEFGGSAPQIPHGAI